MAARLGMNLDSFNLLLNHLPDLGMRQQRYEVYPGLISESLTEDIVRNLPGLRFRTFSDHNSFCERLHAELAPILGREVEKLFCATSEVVQDDPKKYANAFDCMTLEPISGRHQMWMDFQKPLNLAPDRCSKLFYSENLVALQPYRAGTQDPDLEAYQQLAEQGHG